MRKHQMKLLVLLSLSFLSSCGKDGKTGATEIGNPNAQASGTTSIPDEIDSPSGSEGLPQASLSALSTPETKEVLHDLIGPEDTAKLLAALTALDSPSSLQGMSNDLGNAMLFLQSLVQKADDEARQEFTQLLQIIAKELEELRKKVTKPKVKQFAKRNRGRIAGIAKRLAGRHKTKRN